jgi:hypothetical protein
VETGTEREWLNLRDVQEMLGIGHTKAYELVTTPGGYPTSVSARPSASTGGNWTTGWKGRNTRA